MKVYHLSAQFIAGQKTRATYTVSTGDLVGVQKGARFIYKSDGGDRVVLDQLCLLGDLMGNVGIKAECSVHNIQSSLNSIVGFLMDLPNTRVPKDVQAQIHQWALDGAKFTGKGTRIILQQK